MGKIFANDPVDVYSRKPTRATAGRTNLSKFREKAGVYFIVQETLNAKGKAIETELVYVGMSTYDIYKTIMRHFQRWEDSEQPKRISYKSRIVRKSHNYKIAVVECSAAVAKATERALIETYLPKDNKLKIEAIEERTLLQTLLFFLARTEVQFRKRHSKLMQILAQHKPQQSTERSKKLLNIATQTLNNLRKLHQLRETIDPAKSKKR